MQFFVSFRVDCHIEDGLRWYMGVRGGGEGLCRLQHLLHVDLLYFEIGRLESTPLQKCSSLSPFSAAVKATAVTGV
jgi:hypothetical protein